MMLELFPPSTPAGCRNQWVPVQIHVWPPAAAMPGLVTRSIWFVAGSHAICDPPPGGGSDAPPLLNTCQVVPSQPQVSLTGDPDWRWPPKSMICPLCGSNAADVS